MASLGKGLENRRFADFFIYIIYIMENDGINVNINEVTQTTTETSSRIGIFVRNVVLFKSADVLVYFYNPSNNVIRAEMLKLEGDDYTNWGLDDMYIETYVMSKLNLTPV